MRPTRRSCAGSARGWSTGCGSTTRTGWPIRRATCAGSARSPAAAYLLVEKILEPGEAAARPASTARAPPATTPSPTSTGSSSTPPGRTRWTRWTPSCAAAGPADYEEMIRGTKRRITDGILHSEMLRLARLVPSGTGLSGDACRRCPLRDHRCVPGVPHLPAGGRGCPEGGVRPRRRAAVRSWPTPSGCCCRCCSTPARSTAPSSAPLPADLGHGHGQGRGGHRVLPLHPAGHPDRGRRPTPPSSRVGAGGVPPPDGPPPGRAPAVHDHAEHARHQAQRGHPGPDLGDRRGGAGMGRPPWPGCRTWRRCPTGRSPTCSGRPSPAPGRPTGNACSPTPRRPPGRPATPPTGPDPDAAFEEKLAAAVDAAFDNPERPCGTGVPRGAPGAAWCRRIRWRPSWSS